MRELTLGCKKKGVELAQPLSVSNVKGEEQFLAQNTDLSTVIHFYCKPCKCKGHVPQDKDSSIVFVHYMNRWDANACKNRMNQCLHLRPRQARIELRVQ